MGNTVCTDASQHTLEDLQKRRKTFVDNASEVAAWERDARYDNLEHNVRAFAYSFEGGIESGNARNFVKALPVPASDMYALSPAKSYVVLHTQRMMVKKTAPVPRGGDYPTPSDSCVDFATVCEELFTPRGLGSMFGIDLSVVKHRSEARSRDDFIYLYKIYVFNGKKVMPLVVATAVMSAFALERLVINCTGFVAKLFYNFGQAPAAVHVPRPMSQRAAADDLQQFRDHALLRGLYNVLCPPAAGEGSAMASPRRAKVTDAKEQGGAMPRLNIHREAEEEEVDVAPPVHRFRTAPQAKEVIAPSSVSLKISMGESVNPMGPDEYIDDRQERLKALMPVASEITPFLFVGGETASKDRDQLVKKGISCVVNAAAVVIPNESADLFEYISLYLCDSPDEDIEAVFPLVIRKIQGHSETGQGVFIHCHQGVSRSTTLVISFLMWHFGMTLDEALKYAKDRRSIVSPNTGFLARLIHWERHLSNPGPWHVTVYLPFSEQYTFPFTFRGAKHSASDERFIIDSRACYAVHQRTAPGVFKTTFFSGADVCEEMREDALHILEDTRDCAFYTRSTNVSTNNSGESVTFRGVRFDGDIVVAQTAAFERLVSEALSTSAVVGRQPSLDCVLPNDIRTVYAEMMSKRAEAAAAASRRKAHRTDILRLIETHGGSGAFSGLDTTATSGSAGGATTEDCGVESDEDDGTDCVNVFDFPFDQGRNADFIDMQDLQTTDAYAILIRGAKKLNRPHRVYLWIGAESSLDEEEVKDCYRRHIVDTGARLSSRVAASDVEEITIYEGDEPDDFVRMLG